MIVPFKRKKIIFDNLLDRNYRNYLKTEEWAEKRAEIRDKANGECELCFNFIGNKGVVHHINYDNLFNETGSNEMYICRGCHLDAHNNH